MYVLVIMVSVSLLLGGCYVYPSSYSSGMTTKERFRQWDYERQQRYENAQRNQILHNQRRMEQLHRQHRRNY